MGETETTSVARSKGSKEQVFRRNNFGTIVRALWPEKSALNLAQRMGVSERNALQIINGERRVTARAAMVVHQKMLE